MSSHLLPAAEHLPRRGTNRRTHLRHAYQPLCPLAPASLPAHRPAGAHGWPLALRCAGSAPRSGNNTRGVLRPCQAPWSAAHRVPPQSSGCHQETHAPQSLVHTGNTPMHPQWAARMHRQAGPSPRHSDNASEPLLSTGSITKNFFHYIIALALLARNGKK